MLHALVRAMKAVPTSCKGFVDKTRRGLIWHNIFARSVSNHTSVVKTSMASIHAAFALPLGFQRTRIVRTSNKGCLKRRATNLRACANENQRMVPILAVSMTEKGTILFPGGRTVIEVPLEDARRTSEAPNSEFGYISVDAWGSPLPIGTLAFVEEFSSKVSSNSALLSCTGIQRFYTASLAKESITADISPFGDVQLDDYIHEDQRLMSAAEELVRLTKKTGGYNDSMMRLAKRLYWFQGITNENNEQDALPELWYRASTREKMREILSFDLLEESASFTFMERRSLIESVDFSERLDLTINKLEPYIKEMSAKAAIASAFGDQLP